MRRSLLVLFSLIIASAAYSQNLQISGGNNFSAAVCDNQVVYVWGSNTSGQLGVDKDGNPYGMAQSTTPLAVWYDPVTSTGSLPPIRQIDAGSGAHVLGLDCDQQVWAWGENNCGQLGRVGAAACAGTVAEPVPQKVLRGAQPAALGDGTYLSNIFYVSGGNNSSYALEEGTGRVLAWGQNTKGQLGTGDLTNSSTPVYVMTGPGAYLENIVQIEGGDNCAYALDADGYVWSWGGEGDAGSLGRPVAGTNNRYAARVQMDLNFDGNPDVPAVYLSGITQISGGDTHGLGLTGAGEVWSWGGDWGPGQRGNGAGYQYQPVAYQVPMPGVGGITDATAGYRTGPYITGAKYVAAGQASSAVVMGDGRVVTFGANGLFNDPTCPDAGTTDDSQISMYPAGTLGNGGLATQTCTSPITRDDNANSAYGAVSPVYVKTGPGATAFLTGIETVSDGDAWFYATDGDGDAFVWGYNAHGELGLGGADLSAKNYAVSFTLPTGCSFAKPCPPAPDLPADYITCPGFSDTLDTQVPITYSPFMEYEWFSRPLSGGAWTSYKVGADQDKDTVNVFQQYKVTIRDTRSSVPFLCGPCPAVSDSVIISPRPSPYDSAGCIDETARLAFFEITSPADTKIRWYDKPVGGTLLNPLDSLSYIQVRYDQVDSLSNGCTRGLWAEDVASFASTLLPGNTVASAPCAGGTAQIGGDNAALMIEITQDVTIKNVSFVMHNYPYNYSENYYVEICNNDPAAIWCASCTPAGNRDGRGATCVTSAPVNQSHVANAAASVRTLNVDIDLAAPGNMPTKYWIRIRGGEVRHFSCAAAKPAGSHLWSTPVTEPRDAMSALTATFNSDYSGRGTVFDIGFETGTGYDCSRIFVCADGGACVLPVEFAYFNVQREGFSAILNWATASESNSSHFLIQKSADGQNFETIGRVEAAGNSNSLIQYSFNDPKLRSGITYYRLAEYDIDGKVQYSEVRSVSREGIENVKVIPNPNNGSFTVQAIGLAAEAEVKYILRNALSQQVFEAAENVGIAKTINIQHLPSGIYYLETVTEHGNFITKIVKE